ncbi:DUF3300 domain-containing protein [Lysobacter sp. S4-A87]|uniref:DUF3300 domain-containing protein n=1 Tax=Lysobacter sp. S4-A87 TaxID=2925843 RepID=UPI001F53B75A|nr:DUF3300 domain-containing protein [Lysobacter sp. S4-A87]UNK48464.1 DUF3300 domain-containing protein [Lysobacter sp. S4-A87]
MRNHRRIGLLMVLLSLAACSGDKTPAPAATAPAPTPAAPAATPPAAAPAAAPASTSFSKEELDQMVAPIALYPDPLLAQVLMAATYPGNVADAAAWSKANPNAKGDDAVKQVASQPWDPSVQALVAFPQALDTLGQDPAWVQRLGDAFLAQPDAVMDAVQRLRRQAQAAGNLSSNQYQNVTVQAAAPAPAPAPAAAPSDGGTTIIQEAPPPAEQTIIIEPSDPEVVYVPSYNPTEVYGSWAYPSYPPAYYPPSPGYYAGSALMAGLAFGTGIAVTNALWGDCDWGSNDVDIDVNRYNNINTNRTINNSNWQHNSLNRDGVPYRDNASRERYGRQLDGAQNRNQFRGDDPGRADARNRARDSMQQRGIDSPARSNSEARARAQAANRDVQGRDRGQGGGQSRDAQRQRAQSAAQQHASRDRSKPTDLGGNRPNAAQDLASRDRSHNADRDRARAASGGGAGNRSQADRQRAQQTAQNRQQQRPQQHRQTQGNNQARQQARSQHASRQSPNNNAFAGARNPQQSRSQANRGSASHASAQRSHQSRGGGGGGGHQVSRQSRPPQRQGGGGRGR